MLNAELTLIKDLEIVDGSAPQMNLGIVEVWTREDLDATWYVPSPVCIMMTHDEATVENLNMEHQ